MITLSLSGLDGAEAYGKWVLIQARLGVFSSFRLFLPLFSTSPSTFPATLSPILKHVLLLLSMQSVSFSLLFFVINLELYGSGSRDRYQFPFATGRC